MPRWFPGSLVSRASHIFRVRGEKRRKEALRFLRFPPPTKNNHRVSRLYKFLFLLFLFFYFYFFIIIIFYEEEGNGLENRQSNINKHRKTEKHSYSGLRLASAVTRSTGKKTAWPREERAPRMHWMAERSRAKEMVHLSQRIVRL